MKYSIYILLGLLIWVGCDDSEILEPTLEPEPGYLLPQGNHDYDVRIVDWFERCGFYILYKYEPRDLYFNMGKGWLQLSSDTLERTKRYSLNGEATIEGDQITIKDKQTGHRYYYTLGEHYRENGLWYNASLEDEYVVIEEEYIDIKGGVGAFEVSEPDEEQVGKQFQWAEEMFLTHYQDTVWKKYMPLKFILGKNLIMNEKGTVAPKDYATISNLFILSHGDESMDTMTREEKRKIKETLNEWFILQKIYDKIKSIVEAGEFYNVSDYSALTRITGFMIPPSAYYPLGILNYPYSTWTKFEGVKEFKKKDLQSFIKVIISHSYSMLTMPATDGSLVMNDCTSVLDPLKDVNGLIRKKYDILIKNFEEAGIDLQGIGNALY